MRFVGGGGRHFKIFRGDVRLCMTAVEVSIEEEFQ